MRNINILILIACILHSCQTTKSNFTFSKVLWTADWSSNDDLIAIGGNDNELKILSSEDLETLKAIEKPNSITKLKWHPNGELLAITRQWNDESGSEDSQSEIIRIEDNTTINLGVDGARGLGWNHTGEFLAVGTLDGIISIYSKEGKRIKNIQTSQKAITGLSWHPNKDLIVTIGSHIELVDIQSEAKIKIMPREIEILMLCVEWHPSGDFFATGDYGDSNSAYLPFIQFWTAEGEKISETVGNNAEYRNLRWSSDGEYLATVSDKIRILSKEGKLIKERSLGARLWGLDWNSDDSKIVVTSENGDVFVLNNNLKKINEMK